MRLSRHLFCSTCELQCIPNQTRTTTTTMRMTRTIILCRTSVRTFFVVQGDYRLFICKTVFIAFHFPVTVCCQWWWMVQVQSLVRCASRRRRRRIRDGYDDCWGLVWTKTLPGTDDREQSSRSTTCRDVVPVGAGMRRPLPSVVPPTSSCSRGGTPSSPFRFHADDVTGHPPTIIINTVRWVSQPGRLVVCRCRVMTEVSTAKLSTRWSVPTSSYSVFTLASTTCSTLAVHFDRVETDRYVAIIRCTDVGRPPPSTSTLKFATASLSRVRLTAFE